MGVCDSVRGADRDEAKRLTRVVKNLVENLIASADDQRISHGV